MKFNKTYQNHFLNLTVSSNKSELIELLDSLLDFTKPHSEENLINVNFEFSFEEKNPVLFSHHEQNPKGIYQLYCGQEYATASVNFEKQEVKALIFHYQHQIKEHILETIFMRPLRSILAHHNLFYVHCGLIVKNQDCIMLVGESGSGKSTISVVSTNHGYKIATDDNLFLKLEDNKIKFFPMCTKIGANEHFLKRFPKLKSVSGFTYGDKARVSIKELPNSEAAAIYNCKAILFPNFKLGNKFELQETTTAETIKKLAEQSFQRYPEGDLKHKLTPGNFWIINKLANENIALTMNYNENDLDNIFKSIEQKTNAK